jgi:tetratricopeptide (TPR) repeat protein
MSRRKRGKTPVASPPGPAVSTAPVQAATGRRPWVAAGLVVAVVVALAFAAWRFSGTASTPPSGAPATSAVVPGYPANVRCLGCHAAEAAAWRRSHHARAMAARSVETVAGDFGNTRFSHGGVTTRFTSDGDTWRVNTDGPDGRAADFEVRYAFGAWPLQQYLLAMPGGRLQALQVAWDVPGRRWFHLLPRETAPPGDVLHWTGRYQTANTMCLSCHVTAYAKRYDAAADVFDSRWKEPDVSCQACHGPGEMHVQWAEARAAGRTPADLPGHRKGLLAATHATSGRQQEELCAPCHSRRADLTSTPVPGEPLLDNYLLSLLTPGLYHADGQQDDEVFVYGSYRQSRMYARGVGCTHCHEPHRGALRAPGNGTCLQCHGSQPNAEPAFAGAAGRYDTPEHHHHLQGFAGAQCAACHMPPKTYVRLQARPDHSLRVPRPDLSVKLGTPNACNGCHDDRSAAWAVEQVARWYGPKRRQEAHYGEVFAAARAGRREATAALGGLAGDSAQPAVVRATALALLRGDPDAAMEVRLEATRDPDPEVRAAAADSLESAPAARRSYALGPLLRDPVRSVRIAAARALSSLVPAERAAHDAAFTAALAEYVAAQQVSLDMPGSRLNLAVVQAATGHADEAEANYRAALRIDPDFTPARANLADLLNAQARNADAERVLREGLARQPGIGELQYSLGLLLAEDRRLPEAAEALARAAKLMPGRARVHYNLGLALQQLGRRKPAGEALLEAWRLDPGDASVLQAMAIFHAQAGERDKALEWAARLQELRPGDASVRQFVEQLRAGR